MAKHVLVVDDEPATVKMVQVALERIGLEVSTAANGAECLLQVDARRPDLVILDIAMPVLDGYETLRALRNRAETSTLPVIMLTARTADQEVRKGWELRVDDYVTKPFSMDELLSVTQRLLAAGESQGDEGG